MSNWSGGVMTAAGRLLHSKVVSRGIPLKITTMKLGDGVETIDDVDGLVELQNPRYEMTLVSKSIQDELCKVTGMVLSSEIKTGFYARELGLFAQDPDRGEILYMIAIDSNPDYVPPSSHSVTTSAEYSLGIVVSNATEINITLSPTALATNETVTKASCLIERATDYLVGDIVRDMRLRSGYVLECTVAGTTDTEELVLDDVKKGDTVTDGTVTWEVRKLNTLDTVVVNQMINTAITNAVSAEGLDEKISQAVEKAVGDSATEKIEQTVQNAVQQAVGDNVSETVTTIVEEKIAQSQTIQNAVDARIEEKLGTDLGDTINNVINNNTAINEIAQVKQKGTAYLVGDLLYDKQLRPGTLLECTKAGTTSGTGIDLSTAKVGDVVIDGDTVWTVRRINIGTGGSGYNFVYDEDGNMTFG